MSPNEHQPYIPAETRLNEITLRAVVLGVVLSAVLAAANAYLGLFAGMTVSASIPAAVISMAILKMFRDSNVLENNIVQTAASAGESLAAGVIFTIPALIIIGAWTEFNYWEVTMIAAFGGLLGVLFTIPLRRALIVDQPLKFPEGVATAEVLKVGDQGGSSVRYVGWGGLIGVLFKLGSSGMHLWAETAQAARYVGGSIAYIGSNLSPALVGVGYIIGFNVSVVVFAGGALNWWVAIPILAAQQGIDLSADPAGAAGALWSTQTRYLGVGAMVVGGLWALVGLRKSLLSGVRASIDAYRQVRSGSAAGAIPRTEIDAPMQWVGAAMAFSVVPLFFIFNYFTNDVMTSAFMAVVMLVAGFLFSAVAGYMAGLVGSSNNPISGVTIATILTSALLLLAMGTSSAVGPAAAIFIGAVVCCAAAIAGDNMQDLKAGHVLGATPRNQQIMQVVGVGAAAVFMAPILTLLLEAYGIGVPSADHPSPLAAPQSTLMASVASGVFGGALPWNLVMVGMVIAVLVILLDSWLGRRGSEFRTPVLAVAVGIYLPFELEVPMLVGGLLATLASRRLANEGDSAQTKGSQQGLLFASGLITGEALTGIALAVPIVVWGRGDILAIFGSHSMAWPGLILLGIVVVALYRSATRVED